METLEETINRLNLEDWIFITFIVVSILNIYANSLLKKEVIENNKKYQEKADQIFLIVIIISIILYSYFFKRNYNVYKNTQDNKLIIKVLGSLLILIGAVCLLIFQLSDSTTSLTPSV